jgi:hypothetical protein
MLERQSSPRPTSGRATIRLCALIALTALLSCIAPLGLAGAWAAPTLAVRASFSPDRLDATTNLSLTANFLSGTERPPSPVTKFVLYAPGGIGVDLRGAGTCSASTLRQYGPGGCPADSRAGFGGGVGALELPSETIHEPYTLDFFFAPRERGRLRLLVYASAVAPLETELVVVARQVAAPKPYGLGFSVEVPPISTFTNAPNASIESAFVTMGGPNVAYYEQVHGRKTLVHLRGIAVPRRCPSGGFPAEGTVDFADGTTLTVNPTIPCPSS